MTTTIASVQAPVLSQVIAGRAPPLEPLTISQVEQMMAHGILLEGSPVELIDGLLIRKDRSGSGGDPTMHHPRHAVCVSRLQALAARIEPHGCHIRSQLPVALTEFRAPEPDLAIIRGKPAEFRDRHPGPNDIVAVFEVADSSLDFDRSTKQRLYAEAKLARYWIVNLIANCIEEYQTPDPAAGVYRDHQDRAQGETIDIVLPTGATIQVAVDELVL